MKMSASQQELLREAWLGGRDGNLSALAQARAWALREVWRGEKDSEHGMYAYIAAKLTKIGGGRPRGEAVQRLLAQVDNDPEWFPGKSRQEKHGPASAITPTNQALVARSAMTMAAKGQDPTYSTLVARSPKALMNPNTQLPVNKKRVYAIMREWCYDDPEDPDDKWTHGPRNSQNALTAETRRLRYDWGVREQQLGRTATWCFNNLVWTDLCNTILPRTEKRHQEMTLARKGRRGWGSKKTKGRSTKLRGKKEKLKQRSWDSIRVWWDPILAKGKLHLQVLQDNFPGETAEGAALLVAAVRTALNVRFQGASYCATSAVHRHGGKAFTS